MFIWVGLKDYENFSFEEKLYWWVECFFGKFLDFKEFYRGKVWFECCEGKFVFYLVVIILEN